MITDAFDDRSRAILQPAVNENAPKVDACILTFSHKIEAAVIEAFAPNELGETWSSNGRRPIWALPYRGKTFAFLMSYVGAPACVATIEDSYSQFRTDKYILFGGAGCLDKEIAHGKVMIPTAAYRDEGTSYHYAPPSDYIAMPNWKAVAACMRENGIPYALGRTWTTDAIFRETRDRIARRTAEGAKIVEMEQAGCIAVAQCRGIRYGALIYGGDDMSQDERDDRSWRSREGIRYDLVALCKQLVQIL